jgi:hypothetical protein
MFFKLNHILNDIELHIQKEIPFSIVRLGDGDLQILNELNTGNFSSVRSKRESYNVTNSKELLNTYITSCNNANYLSGYDMYLNSEFWRSCNPPSIISKDCISLILNWKNFYLSLGITNNNFCSPELGWQLFLRRKKHKNLLNILSNRKVVLITCFPKASTILKNSGVDVSVISIPGRFGNHYSKINFVKQQIKGLIKNRRIFLIGAGAWGRGYSNYIKQLGGVAIDIGKVCDMWAGKKWIPQYRPYVISNGIIFQITKSGSQYLKFF